MHAGSESHLGLVCGKHAKDTVMHERLLLLVAYSSITLILILFIRVIAKLLRKLQG